MFWSDTSDNTIVYGDLNGYIFKTLVSYEDGEDSTIGESVKVALVRIILLWHSYFVSLERGLQNNGIRIKILATGNVCSVTHDHDNSTASQEPGYSYKEMCLHSGFDPF